MTTEFESRVTDLRAVLQLSRELGASTELMPLLQKVESAALTVLGCERATVFVYDGNSNELYSSVATGVDEIRFPADQGIAGEAVRTGEVIHVPDAYADDRFNPEIDRKTGFRTRNMITIPLVGIDAKIVGVLQVLNKTDGQFDAWDHELVRTFGAQVGVALQRQLLLEHYAEKQRIEHDLSIARDIQQGLIPSRPAQVVGFEVAGWNRPADETGGDCYDYVEREDGSLAVAIADATGHGIGPALVIAECRALFRATVSLSNDLHEVTARVNDLLCEDLPDDRFVTAFFGLLDPDRGVLSYLSGGHGPLFKYTRKTDEIEELPANGFPLGIMPNAEWPTPEIVEMAPGDLFVVVTDGFFECQNPDRQQLGTAKLTDLIRSMRDRPCSEIIAGMHDAVLEWVAGQPQDDDLTALVIRKT
ncbi:MAG: SpoIIE family protein phosphatase [Phycisphaerales bacterium]|nr:SpoIIE family protein phosphatase [Phycisphaerales bacterium]MCB9862376.1 SpoIIE family protein phosphatase [Phycisphaerales bacterium]